MTVGLLVLQLAALVIAADVEVDSDPNKNYEWYPGHYLLLNCTPPSSAELDQSIFGVIRLPRNQVLIATLDGRQELTINCSNDLKLRVTNGKCNDAFCNLHGRCEEMNKGSIHHRFHCICTEKFRGPFCDDEMEGKWYVMQILWAVVIVAFSVLAFAVWRQSRQGQVRTGTNEHLRFVDLINGANDVYS